jgi:hypothetical protein
MSSESEKQNTEGNQEVKKNNWKGFGKSILSAFITTFIWAIIGCNFMFLQRYVADGGEYLGTLFPDDPNKAPYSSGDGSPKIVRQFKASGLKSFSKLKSKRDVTKAGLMSGVKRSSSKAGSDVVKTQQDTQSPVVTSQTSQDTQNETNQAPPKKVTEKTPLLQAVDYPGDESERTGQAGGSASTADPKRVKMLDKLSGLSSYSSPYTLKDSQEGLVGDFKAWIAESIEFSYVNGRKAINTMLNGGDMLSESVSPALVLLLSVPLVALLTSVVPFYGLFSTLIGEFQAPNKGWVWALVFLFVLGFDFILAGVVGFWQTIQVFFTFLLLPLVANASNVFSIMGEHYAFFTGMFGLMVVSNAFSYLRIEASITMFLTYVFLVWKTWKQK